jgi:hypothetical protein
MNLSIIIKFIIPFIKISYSFKYTKDMIQHLTKKWMTSISILSTFSTKKKPISSIKNRRADLLMKNYFNKRI